MELPLPGTEKTAGGAGLGQAGRPGTQFWRLQRHMTVFLWATALGKWGPRAQGEGEAEDILKSLKKGSSSTESVLSLRKTKKIQNYVCPGA